MSQIQSLADLIQRSTSEDGVHPTAINRLSLVRMSRPTEPLHGVHRPALCLITQGKKQVILGDRLIHYDNSHLLIVSTDLPIIGQIIEASEDAPYLCIRLDLDPAMLTTLMLEMNLAPLKTTEPSGLGLISRTDDVTDAMLRLVQLVERPADIAMLAPLYEREILYRLLAGPQSARLRQIAMGESRLHQVNRAIGWIKENFAQPFRIETLAAEARMSPSALHQHFKDVTAMSPLQYQKQLRLQEARRLILGQALDAASAGHQVGYDSPSQFSREYARLFGAPPLKDIARLRAEPGRFAET